MNNRKMSRVYNMQSYGGKNKITFVQTITLKVAPSDEEPVCQWRH